MKASLVSGDPLKRTVKLYLYQDGDQSTLVFRPSPRGYGIEQKSIQPHEAVPDDWHYAELPVDTIAPIYAALSLYLGGDYNTSQLRRDFEHERGRVDRLLSALIEQAQP